MRPCRNEQGRTSSTRTRDLIIMEIKPRIKDIITRYRKRQRAIATGVIKEVPLTKGYVALVSLLDFKRVIKHKWHVAISGTGNLYAKYGKESSTYMHNFIMQHVPGKLTVDHINRNGLHNYRSNLRLATKSQQGANAIRKNQYRGVIETKYPRGRRFNAQIKVNGKSTNIGYYHTAEEAALAYDIKAIEMFGEFAVLNFPDRHTLPELTGFFEPDVRPFKWPTYRRAVTLKELEQPMLFDGQTIQMPRGPCDECHKEIIKYSYTSLTLWNQVAQHRERICSNCFAKLHLKLENDWL